MIQFFNSILLLMNDFFKDLLDFVGGIQNLLSLFHGQSMILIWDPG